MSLAWLLPVLVAIALLDGAFAGYRASAGRDGRLRGRGPRHVVAGLRGAVVAAGLVGPPLVVAAVLARDAAVEAALARAASAIGWVALPYAALFFAALALWLVTPWRSRFVAMALILGPLTLVRPLVAAVTGVASAVHAGELRSAAVALAVTLLPLLVEPLAGRWWYAVGDPRAATAPRSSSPRR